MASKLPPLKVDSQDSQNLEAQNNETAQLNSTNGLTARERRRMRMASRQNTNFDVNNKMEEPVRDKSEKTNEENKQQKVNSPRARRRSSPKKKDMNTSNGYSNSGYVDEENENVEANDLNLPKRHHSKRLPALADASQPSVGPQKPPHVRKKRRARERSAPSNLKSSMLNGLEEDIMEMTNKNDLNKSQTYRSEENLIKSVPSDKFYLELEKKFAAKKKEQYQKQEEDRLRQQFEYMFKQKQKEEQRYQISTPKTALNVHRLLRTIFLFIHGINVGFQFWQIVCVYFVRIDANQLNFNIVEPLLALFQDLIMPIHCLSYLFLTICIVDSMDR
jgi:hypothetical protein